MSPNKNRPLVKPTGSKYDSVPALLKGENLSKEVQAKTQQLAEERRIATQLAHIRQRARITQTEMAKALGVTQSAISKLECEKDDNIKLGEIRAYSKAADERIGLMFGKRRSPSAC